MKVALLGLSHPHSAILLTTLHNLAGVTSICLWDSHYSDSLRNALPVSQKITSAGNDLDQTLADPAVKFAVICVRSDQSAELTRKVIAAGKHVLVEKPVGLTSAEIQELADAAQRQGVVASVMYPRRYHVCAQAARRMIRSGELGNLLTVESRFLTTQVRYRNPDSWLFRRDQAGGGILLWLGCHCLDLFRYVLGEEIVEVSALMATRSGEAIDVEDVVALLLKFSSGTIGTFHAGYTLAFSGEGYVNLNGYDSYLGINAREGRIVWPDLNPRLYIESQSRNGGPPQREESFPQSPSNSYGGSAGEDFFRDFIAAFLNGTPPPTTLMDAVRVAQIVEAANLSQRTGRSVRVAEPKTGPAS